MATTLQEVLGYRNLTALAQGVIGGVPDDILPSSFLTATSRIEGAHGSYKRVSSNRKVARLVHYGSASQRREQLGVTDVPFDCMHTFEHMFHDMSVLTALEREDRQDLQELGQQTIAREAAEFGRYFTNLRVSAVYSALVNGAIYFDSSGNLLPNSTGADTARTIDFSVPANNKDQLNGIIGTTWATDSTDVAGDIKAIKEQARKDTGYPLRWAFYGANILEYLCSNTALANLINASPMASSFAGNEIPDGFLGLNWRPANEAFFVDNDGSTQDFWSGDTVVFTPDPSPDWWEIVEGSYAVPTSMTVATDANSAKSGSMTRVYGAFSYAHPSMDPPGIKHLAGDTFLPLLKVPGAIFIADVVP